MRGRFRILHSLWQKISEFLFTGGEEKFPASFVMYRYACGNEKYSRQLNVNETMWEQDNTK